MRMTSLRFLGVIAALGLVLIAAPARAHHSFAAAFDENHPINLQGTVTKVELVNPHAWIWIDVKAPDGTVTNWGMPYPREAPGVPKPSRSRGASRRQQPLS